ncbi:hypothetical protein NDU88_008204 [Pleurodeles waltl]|uniref:Gypsy retrotransposon integrase-like protein 1 n=1 Tax=Pleurodeles waltl TaxID=8319 RepID=A0AAV7PPP8_PLEWA|nr:hypothetical protein NDU88_008204 [Pleurodeles waltl]
MATYYGMFIPNLATLAEPLRQLTKANSPWESGFEVDKAFQAVKSSLLDSVVMTYFHPHKKTEVMVDYSPIGLGAVLLQDRATSSGRQWPMPTWPSRQRMPGMRKLSWKRWPYDGPGQRLVIPCSLHLRVVELAYQGHQGTAKTKACLREKVWFPRMNAMVDDLIPTGDPCAITARDTVLAPVMTKPPSTRPWPRVSLDFGSFPDGWLTAVMTDLCARFLMVELVTSTAFEHVHPVLEKVFALLGLLEDITMDNGPLFHGQEFQVSFAISHW